MIRPTLGNFAATLIHAASWMHLAHFKCNSVPGSYAKHIALQSFYEDVVESADAIVEKLLSVTWIEDYQDISLELTKGKMPYDVPEEYLKNLREFIVTVRKTLIPGDEYASLNSLVDDYINIIDSALYNITRLK